MKPSIQSQGNDAISRDFKNFILEENHPCIMANTVFQMEKYQLNVYESLGSKKTAIALMADLKNYIAHYDFESKDFESFIAVFPEAEVVSEIEFENLLWRQLQFLHEIDIKPWDPTVSEDPNNPNFSFSLGGKAFYVVGLHPLASRMARRSPYPTLVFNLHSQFEKLREMGVYYKVRDKIRERDAALQGSINPVLQDFGEESEARQYSGRQVGQTWKCPFHHK
ncbi:MULTISPECIES: guanitoxin biosynthesis heme-dependent pre-guanitoxin N-hydroxylase GntA [Aequorivita]|uniref:YqcI/YcgG family protein n=1 Tax=Aequorivita iocasae TaxID=2803865 RepID=A0ABX7DN83_9FLAO|nr:MULTISPECIES: guanitoxin biosynthesis heme-dependent pre-guanitoxin N-hydroxylase GntA [Aequorivita]QQX75494.1 YqcI/YcgG family protein [Aequorivita iocasae]UCA54947.1 YqcI/YcgG family protein [Aequorivita sp. F7]